MTSVALPTHLQVEITSACNLRCTMCLVSYRPPVNKLTGAMPLDLFRRLVGDLPGLRRITLQGLGEPLLSPFLLDMIRTAVERDIRVGFNSNATLLHRRRATELVASGVDWLHVSLDGASSAAYEKIRGGARYETVVANLAGLVDAKRAAGSATPWIRVVFVAMRDNVDELPALVRLLASIGVDELRVQNLSHSFSDTDPAGRYAEIRAFTADQALWTDDPDYGDALEAAAETGLQLRLPSASPLPSTDRGCDWPWEAVYVTSAGAVQPCCMVMGDDRATLGHLGEQSFPEIWNGPAYREFRRRLMSDEPPEVCRGCSLYRGTF